MANITGSTLEKYKTRLYKVVKANDLIRSTKYELSITEQKILNYVISMIKPTDTILPLFEFEIKEYCKIAGIDYDSGTNYANIKKSVKSLADRSFWLSVDEGKTLLFRWVTNAIINEGSGTILIELNPILKKYLINQKENFTAYELLSTLPMTSQYSFRIYELLKSYEFVKAVTFDIDDLKVKLKCESYTRFADFRRYILEKSCEEINNYTDLKVSYELIKKGRRYASIRFKIERKTTHEQYIIWENTTKNLG